MAHTVDNPRFPHKVQIITETINQTTGDPEKKVVFESECGLRDMVRGVDAQADVIKSDYKLAIPKTTFLIKTGDTVRFIHSYNGEVIDGVVESYRAFNLGCNIWFQVH